MLFTVLKSSKKSSKFVIISEIVLSNNHKIPVNSLKAPLQLNNNKKSPFELLFKYQSIVLTIYLILDSVKLNKPVFGWKKKSTNQPH